MIEQQKNLPLLIEIENHFKLISFKKGEIEFDLTPDARSQLVLDMSKVLSRNSQFQWKFLRTKDESNKTIAVQREEAKLLQKKKIDNNLTVKEVMKIFPGTIIGKSTFH
mgnify:FL=1